MAQETQAVERGNWLEVIGLTHILRTLALAIQPAKLVLGLGGIAATYLWGWSLDGIWGGKIDVSAVARFVAARELDQPYVEPSGSHGIFHTWLGHERHCILGLMGSSVPGTSVVAGTPLGRYVESHAGYQPLRNLIGMGDGVWWMLRFHPLYFVLFVAGALLIWSFFGGAICRMAAVQFAQDEKLTAWQALTYARKRLFDGFFMAPCIPIALILLTMIVMALGGLFLRIPLFGDLIGGLLFFLALLGGFLIAILHLGLLVGGSLFWPAVATEGSDAFDAFSRALSYPLSRPLKAILYAILMIVFASICWVLVHLFTYFALLITRGVVSFGTAPFGWLSRTVGEDGPSISKIEMIWPLGGPNDLHSWPDWSQLQWYDGISAVLVGVYVMIVIGFMWSFLVSFYFSGSTIIYALLRRDVDNIDLEEVHRDEEEPAGDVGGSAALPVAGATGAETPSPEKNNDISLPLAGGEDKESHGSAPM